MTTPIQSLANTEIVFREETTYGQLAPNDASAFVLRRNPSPGLSMSKQLIQSNEVRRDLQSTRGRHGRRSVSGTYTVELSVGSFDPIFQAALRGTWAPAASAVNLGATTITIDPVAGTITRSAGSWISDGLRIGDVVTFSNIGVNGAVPFNIRALTATVLTVGNPGMIVSALGATANGSFVRARRLIQPTLPVRRSYNVEQYGRDMDESLIGVGTRILGFSLQATPDEIATMTITLQGQNMLDQTPLNAPRFTNAPAAPETPPLVLIDGFVTVGGQVTADVTSVSLEYSLAAQAEATLSPTSPDVLEGRASVSGSVSLTRRNLDRWRAFANETTGVLSLFFRFGTTFLAITVPELTFGGADADAAGTEGAVIETIPLIVGVATQAEAERTMLHLATSA